jgi:hypothetical protein
VSFKKGILLIGLGVHLCLVGIAFAYMDGMYHWDTSLETCLESENKRWRKETLLQRPGMTKGK